jgi:Fe-Mn family superoxide dismutase
MVAMAFELPPLPYPKNALEPHISERTMDFHHGRHHQAYVTNLNNLVKGSPAEQQSLEEIIKATYKDTSKTGVFNNAAQVWNHTFFWNCMKPNGGGSPTGQVAQAMPNAINPLADGQTALLTCDVWEHAYYLDYQNRRPDFVQTFIDHLINWDFVAQNLAKAR